MMQVYVGFAWINRKYEIIDKSIWAILAAVIAFFLARIGL